MNFVIQVKVIIPSLTRSFSPERFQSGHRAIRRVFPTSYVMPKTNKYSLMPLETTEDLSKNMVKSAIKSADVNPNNFKK